jgi:hypothetical protein
VGMIGPNRVTCSLDRAGHRRRGVEARYSTAGTPERVELLIVRPHLKRLRPRLATRSRSLAARQPGFRRSMPTASKLLPAPSGDDAPGRNLHAHFHLALSPTLGQRLPMYVGRRVRI